MERKIDFTVKHREDIIDTLHLRAREKKVLAALLLVFFITVAYENYDVISRYFFSEDFITPALGKRQTLLVKPDQIAQIGRSLAAVEGQFPQFAELFVKFHRELETAARLAAAEETRQQATYNIFILARELYKFSANPVLTRSKELEALNSQLLLLQKRMRFDLQTEDQVKSVSFVRSESESNEANIHRNLFDYENF